jgi:hypothetical protein
MKPALCYSIQSTSDFSVEKFPFDGYCLDLGHLNVAVGRKILGMDLMDFINKIKD